MPQNVSTNVFMNGQQVLVTVTVTTPKNMNFDDVDIRIICETACGLTDLHQTTKAKNLGACLGYMHNYVSNDLYAVSAMANGTAANSYTMTISQTGRAQTKNGKKTHIF